MKWGIGIFCLVTLTYFAAPIIYRQMKKHDFENLYNGLQGAKASAGANYEDPRKKKFLSYSDRYLLGDVE